MRKTVFSVFVLLTVLLLASCGGTAKITTEITPEIEDQELGLKAWIEDGSYLYVEIKGNPTTGYVWGYRIDNANVVENVVSEYQMDKSEYEMVGVGGIYTFTFQAKQEGTAHIILSYSRSWEVSTLSTAAFDVTVDANGNISSLVLAGVER